MTIEVKKVELVDILRVALERVQIKEIGVGFEIFLGSRMRETLVTDNESLGELILADEPLVRCAVQHIAGIALRANQLL